MQAFLQLNGLVPSAAVSHPPASPFAELAHGASSVPDGYFYVSSILAFSVGGVPAVSVLSIEPEPVVESQAVYHASKASVNAEALTHQVYAALALLAVAAFAATPAALKASTEVASAAHVSVTVTPDLSEAMQASEPASLAVLAAASRLAELPHSVCEPSVQPVPH
jgi:hypothetical protein